MSVLKKSLIGVFVVNIFLSSLIVGCSQNKPSSANWSQTQQSVQSSTQPYMQQPVQKNSQSQTPLSSTAQVAQQEYTRAENAFAQGNYLAASGIYAALADNNGNGYSLAEGPYNENGTLKNTKWKSSLCDYLEGLQLQRQGDQAYAYSFFDSAKSYCPPEGYSAMRKAASDIASH